MFHKGRLHQPKSFCLKMVTLQGYRLRLMIILQSAAELPCGAIQLAGQLWENQDLKQKSWLHCSQGIAWWFRVRRRWIPPGSVDTYIALAGGGSFTTRNISMHTKTNIWVTEQFLPVKFKVGKSDTGCSGCGFKPCRLKPGDLGTYLIWMWIWQEWKNQIYNTISMRNAFNKIRSET